MAIGHALLELGDGYRKSAAHWLRRARALNRRTTNRVWIATKKAFLKGDK